MEEGKQTCLTDLSRRKFLRVSLVSHLVVTAGVAAQGRGGENNAGKTAVEVYKNIQVLKDVPADQITPTMRVIARDLDVTCEFCHDERTVPKMVWKLRTPLAP